MTDILDLHPDWITRPGYKVITSEQESLRGKEAYARKRLVELREARAKFSNAYGPR